MLLRNFFHLLFSFRFSSSFDAVTFSAFEHSWHLYILPLLLPPPNIRNEIQVMSSHNIPIFHCLSRLFIIISAWIICSVNSILKLILKIIRNHSRLIIFIILDFVCFSHFYFYFYQNIQAVDKTMKYMIVST